jgi:hypothetical protein
MVIAEAETFQTKKSVTEKIDMRNLFTTQKADAPTKDLLGAEMQLVKALPEMVDASHHPN